VLLLDAAELQLTAVLEVLQECCLHVIQLLLLLRLYLLPAAIRVDSLQVSTDAKEHSSEDMLPVSAALSCAAPIIAHPCTTACSHNREHML
jgi:hypothetical protein